MQPDRTSNINFFAGVVDKSGNKHVLMGAAVPTLEEIFDVTHQNHDWGETASHDAAFSLAQMILEEVDGSVAVNVVRAYTEKVIRKMDSSRMWLLRREEVEKWLAEYQVIQ